MKVLNKIILGLITAFLFINSAYADEMKSGESLFKKCAACHGAGAQKHALGKSAILNSMSEEELSLAIVGYQKGTYGRDMKVLMKNQVSALSLEDIKAVTHYITSLKK